MASTKDYLEFVMEQLSDLNDVSYRPMMGEYVLYYRGKVIGGIYDDRFLIKPTPSAKRLMPDAPEELPYEGAKPMLSVVALEDRNFLRQLFDAVEKEVPAKRSRASASR